jgi:BirA family biotin operon repressor/biotin-[acetyl-CoA-carboxylase] ligase
VLRPLDERHLLLPLAAPVAVCEAAESLHPGLECAIKWPNDVWVKGRKLAGILIEARPQDGWAVIGAGLNLAIERDEFPPDLREMATSLSQHGWQAPPEGAGREAARAALDAALGRWVEAEQDAILDEWRARDALRGREVSWDEDSEEGGSGIADGVDDRGRLVVVIAGGRTVLGAGEVHLRL